MSASFSAFSGKTISKPWAPCGKTDTHLERPPQPRHGTVQPESKTFGWCYNSGDDDIGRESDGLAGVSSGNLGDGWLVCSVLLLVWSPLEFCFPSLLFSLVKARILAAKGWQHVSILWLQAPRTDHWGLPSLRSTCFRFATNACAWAWQAAIGMQLVSAQLWLEKSPATNVWPSRSSLQSRGVLGIRSVQRKTFSRLVLPQAFFQMPASKMQVLLTPAIWCHCWNLAWNELEAHLFFTTASPFPETREGWAQFSLEPCCYHDVSDNDQKTCWGQELCS